MGEFKFTEITTKFKDPTYWRFRFKQSLDDSYISKLRRPHWEFFIPSNALNIWSQTDSPLAVSDMMRTSENLWNLSQHVGGTSTR